MLAAGNFGGQNRCHSPKGANLEQTDSGDDHMPLRNPSGWWRRTRLRSWAAAMIVAVLATGGAWFAIHPGAAKLFSIPLALLIAVVLLPFALAIGVHWLALRQEKLDRDFSVWEGR